MIKRRYLILLAMTGMLVSLDQLSKLLIVNNFQVGETRPVVDNFFNLTLVYNPGAAFGFLASLPGHWREPIFLIVPLLTLMAVLMIFAKCKEEQGRNIFALALIFAGAVGNLIDRLRLGYVIDFLDFHWKLQSHFPAFNVADSAISIGVALLLFGIIFEKVDKNDVSSSF